MKDNTRTRDRSIVLAFPGYLILLVLMVAPVIVSAINSLLDREGHFTFANYMQIIGDPNYRHVFYNNFIWILLAPILTLAWGTLMAMLIYRYIRSNIANVIMFMPMAISLLSTGIIFRIIFQTFPENGPLNTFLKSVLHVEPRWLDSKLITVSMIIAFIWVWSGFITSLVLAFLREFNKNIMNAALIDGANYIQIFFYIILPNMKNTIIIALSSLVIYVLKIFDFIVVIPNNSIQGDASVISYEIWYLFYGSYGDVGLSSALSILLLLLILPISFINVKLLYGAKR